MQFIMTGSIAELFACTHSQKDSEIFFHHLQKGSKKYFWNEMCSVPFCCTSQLLQGGLGRRFQPCVLFSSNMLCQKISATSIKIELGLLGEKQECYLCPLQPPPPVYFLCHWSYFDANAVKRFYFRTKKKNFTVLKVCCMNSNLDELPSIRNSRSASED